MKFKNKFLAFLLILIMLFSVTACHSTEDAYIYFELPEIPSTLDAQTASTDSELLIINNIYEGLMRKNADGKVVCGVADSYDIKGNVYTFNIRKDAKWNNGDDVTADDFVFAFKRALNPETKAPFASRLFCIKNAKSVNSGSLSVDELSVFAENEKTLKIEVEYFDEEFLSNLATSVAMPCNRSFFNSSFGKYGIFKDYIISNSSYRLTKWNKESFGIRLYRNEEYTGKFYAKNAAVFLTCNKDESVIEKLEKNSIDMAFIDSSLSDKVLSFGLKTIDFQNTCWVMTIGDNFSHNMRKALSMLVSGEIYSENLASGYTVATSIFPGVISENTTAQGLTFYDIETAKTLFNSEINRFENKKFPSNITLYYYDNGYIKPVITDIVGHWQSNLSAFINIEAASSVDLLKSQLTEQTYSFSVFPITANTGSFKEYIQKFKIQYQGQSISELQTDILKSNNIIPLAFQNTTICYSPSLANVVSYNGNGYIDFSFIIKTE